jgi:hypothetical protein
VGWVLDQGGQPQPTLARTITDDRPKKDPIQRTEASLTLSSDSIPALNPASSPSQPRASFTISANFILPSSATIEIYRLISHKFKSLMGIHSRSFPSSRQTDPCYNTACKIKKMTALSKPTPTAPQMRRARTVPFGEKKNNRVLLRTCGHCRRHR